MAKSALKVPAGRNCAVLKDPNRILSVCRHPALHEVVGERIVTEDQQVWLSRDEIFAD
ncbi:MAG: hypothetical protein ABSF25_14390 [Bryobacteraceae bacterium]|jgi:hypothetical protein